MHALIMCTLIGSNIRAQLIPLDSLMLNPLFAQIQTYYHARPGQEKAVILFASSHTCSKCYEQLERVFKQNKVLQNCQFIVVVRMVNNPQVRREFIKKYPIFAAADTLFFEDVSQGQFMETHVKGGLMGKLEIHYTPAVLFIKQEEIAYWSNQRIFDDHLHFTKEFKRKIKTLSR